MHLRMLSKHAVLFFLFFVFTTPPAFTPRTAESLPSQISDADYWRMVSEFSEPGGYFQYDIVTSNEMSYQYVLPDLMKRIKPGGAYLGVGPEQNFTYIAATRPQIAFIIDIRRDMLLEHLLYKSIFEMSADRVQFVAALFSRRVPPDVTAGSSVEALFRAFSKMPADPKLADEHAGNIIARLKTHHGFPLTSDDEKIIRAIYRTFVQEGVLTFTSSFMSPGYATLMTLTDGAGKNWSFLATKENYDFVRSMHQKNLIVPLAGDFAGPKAIRTVGQYLKDHAANLNVFYISNVEDYIRAWPQYAGNIASLPHNDSSLFIRWSPGYSTTLDSIADFVRTHPTTR
jgi:hypothetical protein